MSSTRNYVKCAVISGRGSECITSLTLIRSCNFETKKFRHTISLLSFTLLFSRLVKLDYTELAVNEVYLHVTSKVSMSLTVSYDSSTGATTVGQQLRRT